MEPPTAKEIVKSEKTYSIISDKNHSLLTVFKNLISSIEINVIFQDDIIKHIYNTKLTLNEIKQNNKYFSLYETIDEIYDDLILLMNKNQTKILEDTNLISISIPLESVKFKELLFVLNEVKKNEKETLQELFSIILDLKKEIKDIKNNNSQEIKQLKEENVKLKEKINTLETYIPYLEEYKKKTEEKKNKHMIKNLDSLIINDNKKYNTTLKNWINPNLNIKAKLLYRASRDGEEYETFHKLCDNKGPTIVLAKLSDGNILGTYTPLDWETKSYWKTDPNIFVFSLTENIKALKKDTNNNYGIYCDKSYGPESYFLCFKPEKKMKEPQLRIDTSEYTIDTQSLAPGKKDGNYYKADEVEIFKIIYE